MRGLGIIKNLFKGGTDAEAPAADAGGDRRNGSRTDARAGLRVLIVDDSSTVLALLAKMLQQNGYETLQADSGEAAIEIATREQPELIFLDIVLPTMSGFAVLRALRREARTHDIPVVMISGNLRATEEFYGQRIGADGFMKKPFSRADVFALIAELVERGRLPPREGDAAAPPAHDDEHHDVLVHDDLAVVPGADGPDGPRPAHAG
jgi:DNA-binding response OmpR family regulator